MSRRGRAGCFLAGLVGGPLVLLGAVWAAERRGPALEVRGW